MADMNVNVEDIRRALLAGGNVSAFANALRSALGNPPVCSITALGTRAELPDPATLSQNVDRELGALVQAWTDGQTTVNSFADMAEIIPIVVPFDSPDGASHVTRIIDRIAPDVITIDLSPLELSSHSLYTFSLLSAVGLPMHGQVRDKASRQVYSTEAYYPYTAAPAVIYRCFADKIALVPVGMPFMPGHTRGGAEQTDERRVKESTLLAPSGAVYQDYFNDIDFAGVDMSIAGNPLTAVSSARREMLIEEAIYVASRIAETAAVVGNRNKRLKVLALIDAKYYDDAQYTIELHSKAIVNDDTYIRPRADIPADSAEFIVGSRSVDVDRTNAVQTTALQKAFTIELEGMSSLVHREQLRPESIDSTLAQIASHVRSHPETKRSLSVRGAIALKEVLHGYTDIDGALTVKNVEKAAITTLPHRIYTQYQGYDMALSIVNDALKEVLYGFSFYVPAVEEAGRDVEQHSAAAGLAGEQSPVEADASEQDSGEMGDVEAEQSPDAATDGEHDEQSSALLPDSLAPRGQETSEQEFKSDDLFEYVIERTDKKDEHLKTAKGGKPQGKRKGQTSRNQPSRFKTDISEEDLAKTLMEMMDAKDKQWQKGLGTRDLHVYYHLRGERDGKPLNKMKQEQHGLKAIVDFLGEEDLLKSDADAEKLELTYKAMDVLLEQLISKILSGKQIEHLIGFGATRLSEHSRATRRYRVGDVFKDISIRHTLKELARQHKQPSEISRHDIRVFIREKERVQSDIILCVDSSSSMGYHHKLLFARLAASGLAKSALGKGDRIGVVTFNDLGRAVIPLTEIKEDIFEHIIELTAGGNTNIGDGIKCAAEMLMRERNHNQKFIVLITDGEPTAISSDSYARVNSYERASRNAEGKMSEKDILTQTRKAATKGIKTSVIHCTRGGGNHRAFVKNIARLGAGRVIKITSMDDLRALMA